MSPRPDVSEERRTQIIEAAARVLVREGYRKTTMPDVAREAGLSVGGIYWYFKGKEELVHAILSQCFQNDLAELDRLLNADAPAAQRLKTAVEEYADRFMAQVWINPLGIAFYGEASHDSRVRGYIQDYLARYRQALVTLIEQGIQRGEFRPVNPADTANAILGLEEGLALILNADANNVRWREAFLGGMDLILAGLTQMEQK